MNRDVKIILSGIGLALGATLFAVLAANLLYHPKKCSNVALKLKFPPMASR